MSIRHLAIPALLLLSACGGDTARTFGFTRDAPDEFQVTTRAPLALPPSLGNLPRPTPGSGRPQEVPISTQAEAVLAPGAILGSQTPARATTGERALLSASGTAPVSGNIRSQIDSESLRLNAEDRTLTERLMFWRGPETAGTAVDTTREQQRLRENAALGRAPTEGETPIIQRPRSGTFLGGLRLF
ncbi:DUF3035 domain-containing protein [Rhodovarius lipocyclicus]|uniref:DUF3035 domain-containing protein n=1 Tax=Rhodovarius lipocyclicus TaxID=268410 RepID=UPI0013597BBD|nr:DUF3035 domain-containing protein [Rhodovarius lipocyclicus]